MGDNGRNNLLPEINESTRSAIEFYTERFEAISDSAVGLFRINLVIVGLFLPLISGLLNPTPTEIAPSDIFNNPITQIGLFVWTLSMIATMATHHYTRKYSISQYTPFQEYLKDPDSGELQVGIADSIEYYGFQVGHASKALSVCFILSFVAVGLLAVGFIEPFVDFEPTRTFLYAIILFFMSLFVVTGLVGILRVGVSRHALLAGLDRILPSINIISYRIVGPTLYHTKWDQLTQVRRSLLRTIVEEIGEKEFTSTELKKAIEVATLTTPVPAQYVSTTLLDRLVDDNYLMKIPGPKVPLIVDTKAAENEKQVAVFGSDDIQELMEQVIEREGLHLSYSDLDHTNPNEVIKRINHAAGEQILIITKSPNKYKLSDEALELLSEFIDIEGAKKKQW